MTTTTTKPTFPEDLNLADYFLFDRIREGRDISWSRAGPTRAADLVEIDLDQAIHPYLLLPGGLVERVDEAKPVNRVHEARVRDHRRALVRLQSTDKVPAQRRHRDW